MVLWKQNDLGLFPIQFYPTAALLITTSLCLQRKKDEQGWGVLLIYFVFLQKALYNNNGTVVFTKKNEGNTNKVRPL